MKKHLLYLLVLFLFLASCNNDDDLTEEENEEVTVTLDSEVNEFIWKGLNHWYLWQEEQTVLNDDYFASTDDFYTYLNSYNTSEGLFDDLIYQPGVVDDFSWYIEDISEQEDSFNGISTSYGIGFPGSLIRVSEDNEYVVIYVAYVDEGSPADLAGIERGDIISRVDGETMTLTNYAIINKIFTEENLSLGFADIVDGELTPIEGEVELTATTFTSNPINYFDVLDVSNTKIGYLVYNSFTSTFNGELEDVFTYFNEQSITELVLDLRYNGGGSVLTSDILASMIDGGATANSDAFASLEYNSKRSDQNFTYPFLDENYIYSKDGDFEGTEVLTRLNTLSRLYVLTGSGTASASEMIINGLRPYMEVIIVGETTVGKNEGSITVVDAPDGDDSVKYTESGSNLNTSHTIGMQPIVFQIYNSLGQSDYTLGFDPDIYVDEYSYTSDIKAFGDTDEALLNAALNDMLGTSTGKASLSKNSNFSRTDKSMKQPKFSAEMYLRDTENLKFK
ncbi:peptidase S41 [Cellulophaga baltica]|uniref:S41 family peptidase n=1 Tax=Cellulophaga TaxID=104264 RepID=UPI001C067875|nr:MULTISPECIES: S41 family peptidase [Cellulophaga]MBU2997414.1 peptidase S41 [Cellulophaga baltica]MDO6768811.1 S41 family peptidase [Cellulophaga sp. 1_MG-2023]